MRAYLDTKWIRLGGLIIPLCLSAGCVAINRYHDRFDGHTRYALAANPIENSVADTACTIQLLPERFEARDKDVRYNLIVQYTGDGWIFIPEGESLVLLVDGQPIAFTGKGSEQGQRVILEGSSVLETAFYLSVKPQVLHRIADARSVEVKLNTGDDTFILGRFTPLNLYQFRTFVKKHVDLPDKAVAADEDFKHPQYALQNDTNRRMQQIVGWGPQTPKQRLEGSGSNEPIARRSVEYQGRSYGPIR